MWKSQKIYKKHNIYKHKHNSIIKTLSINFYDEKNHLTKVEEIKETSLSLKLKKEYGF